MDADLQKFLFSLLGALLAWGYLELSKYLKGRAEVPFFDVQEAFMAFAAAATANPDMKTDKQMLQYAVDLGTKYLKAKGLLGVYDPTALAEYGHMLEKMRFGKPNPSPEILNVAKE
jgi:hypothetical protein